MTLPECMILACCISALDKKEYDKCRSMIEELISKSGYEELLK